MIHTDQDIVFKRSGSKSILLVATKDEIVAKIGAVIAEMPKHSFNTQISSLADLNGAAIDIGRDNDLVIYETTVDSTADLGAVSAMRDELDQQVKILAVTAHDITLSEARRIISAGADEVMTFPFEEEELRENVRRLTSPNPLLVIAPEPVASDVSGTVIAVAKSCGGIGGTTIAVNLADRLLQRTGVIKKTSRNRVVLVDLDLQFGAVASFLDVDPRNLLYQLAEDGAKPDATFLQQSLVSTTGGIDVLTAPARFAPLNSLSTDQTGAMIDLLRAEYDYVVVDLPHALVEWVAPVLEKADRLLMVTDSSVPSIRQARRLIDFYTEDNIGLPIDIVVNREKKPLIKGGSYKEASNVLERPLKYWLPPDPRTARAAADRGQPLAEISGRSPLTKAMNALAKSLSEDIAEKRKSKVLPLQNRKAI